MNRKKEYDWFEKHKNKCDELKDQYMYCLNEKKSIYKIEDTPCKSILNKLLFNNCFIYDDIRLQIIK